MGRVSFPQAKPQTQLVPLNSLLFSLSGFLVVFLPHPTKPLTSCELARLTGGLGYSRKSVCGNSCQAGKSSVHGRH